MKQILLFLIKAYQVLISPTLAQVFGAHCRFEKTCSEYAKESIKENGILRGGLIAAKRVLSCNPMSKSVTKAI